MKSTDEALSARITDARRVSMKGRVLLFAAVLALCACNRLTEVGENDTGGLSSPSQTTPDAGGGEDAGDNVDDDGGTQIVDAGEAPPCGWQVAAGPEGAQVRAMHVAADGIVFAGTSRGIYRSEDQGVTWKRPAHASPPEAFVTAFTELNGTLYAAFNSNGIWASEDGGDTWVERNAGLVNPITFNVTATGSDVFALSQTNAGPKLYRWNVELEQWVGVDAPAAFSAIAATGETLIGTVSYFAEVQLSTNGGQSWTAGTDQNLGINEMVVAGAYVVGLPLSGNAPYVSTDDGYSWTLLTPPQEVLGAPFSATEHDGRLVIAWAEGVFAWDGTAWSKLGNSTPTGYYSEVKVLTSNGARLFGGSFADGVYTLASDGAPWTLSSSGLSAVMVRALEADGPMVYASTGSSGLHVSRDHGATWSRSLEGIPAAAGVSAVAVHGERAFIGTYAHGVYTSLNQGQSWTLASTQFPTESNGSLVRVAAIAAHGDTVLAAADWGQQGSLGMLRSEDNGATWAKANGGRTPMGYDSFGKPYYSAAEFVGFAGGAWFIGTATDGLFRSTDDGKSWVSANGGLPYYPEYSYGTITSVVEAQGALFAVGRIYNGQEVEPIIAKSTNGGQSWTQITNGFPQDEAAHDLAAIGDSLYVSSGLSASNQGGVYRSDDGGAKWTRLDSLPVTAKAGLLAASGTRLVVGTEGAGAVTLETGVCQQQ